jgi:hypothetical protein
MINNFALFYSNNNNGKNKIPFGPYKFALRIYNEYNF